MASILPTKSNLIAAKNSRDLAKTGFDLMDRKRNILARELMGLIDKAETLQSQIGTVFNTAYDSLRMSNIALGKSDRIAEATVPDNGLTLRYRSVMGVELPSVIGEDKPLTLPYGFIDTGAVLDDAYIKFNRVKVLIRELSETENTIYRLAYSIKKTQKRANALKNVVIPDLDRTIRSIADSLEEKEREDFVRLKVIKANSRE